jgi:hypothetical protein
VSKLKQILVIGGLLLSPLAVSMPASATDSDSCTISNTGPGSNNTCTSNETYTCEVDTDNKVTIRDENDQVVGTGSATTTGNTSGGNATSGSASNQNGTTYTISIDNEGCEVTAVSTPVAPTPTPSQPTNGLGAAGGSGAVVAAAPRPTVLPNTSGENFALVGLAVAGVLAAVAAAARGLNLLQNRR